MPTPTAPSLATARPIDQFAIPTIASRDLLQGQQRIDIEHDGRRYTLRVTRENKLILTK